MRSPEEQEDFLERGRFGEGDQGLTARIPLLVGVGLFCFVDGASCLAAMILLDIGRDDGGPLYLMGAILSGVAGLVCCLLGWVSTRWQRSDGCVKSFV